MGDSYFENNVEETDPFFNMAKRTLEGLDLIKKQMLINDLYQKASPDKQQTSIELLKKFYMFSIPLFPEDEIKDMQEMEEEILGLKLETKNMVKSGNQSLRPIYSKQLEDKINKLFIKMSKLLKPYLMPAKRDDDGL